MNAMLLSVGALDVAPSEMRATHMLPPPPQLISVGQVVSVWCQLPSSQQGSSPDTKHCSHQTVVWTQWTARLQVKSLSALERLFQSYW